MLGGMAGVTQILSAIKAGDPHTAELLPLVYDGLRKLTAARLPVRLFAPCGTSCAMLPASCRERRLRPVATRVARPASSCTREVPCPVALARTITPA